MNSSLPTVFFVFFSTFALAASGAVPRKKEVSPALSLSPASVREGQIISIRVSEAAWASRENLSVESMGQKINWFACAPSPSVSHCGLIAVPLETPPGEKEVVFQWTERGEPRTETLRYRVRKSSSRVTQLQVDPSRVTPSPEEQARIEEEKKELEAAVATSHPSPLWSQRFVPPTDTGSTGGFGTRRVYNGELKGIHQGLDLRGNEKTPIYVSQAGTVKLAKNLFYAGNIVLVDHGQGIFSSYAHLSRIDVKPGQRLAQGEKVGMAGATGRVTGPHLHWAMRVNGFSVDPAQATRTLNRLLKNAPRNFLTKSKELNSRL